MGTCIVPSPIRNNGGRNNASGRNSGGRNSGGRNYGGRNSGGRNNDPAPFITVIAIMISEHVFQVIMQKGYAMQFVSANRFTRLLICSQKLYKLQIKKFVAFTRLVYFRQ